MMDEKQLQEIYNSIISRDPSYKDDISFDVFKQKMSENEYQKKITSWLGVDTPGVKTQTGPLTEYQKQVIGTAQPKAKDKIGQLVSDINLGKVDVREWNKAPEFLDKQLSSVTPELLSQQEEFVVPKLKYQFEPLGFKFEEFGAGDNMRVTSPDKKTIEVSLDDNGNIKDTERLKNFLKYRSLAIPNLSNFEKEYQKEKTKITSEKEASDYISSFSKKQDSIRSNIKEIYRQRDLIQDQIDDLPSMQSALGAAASFFGQGKEKYTPATEEEKIKLADLMKKRSELDKKLVEIVSSSEYKSLQDDRSSLSKFIGAYTEMKSQQGDMTGAIFNSLLTGYGRMSADVMGGLIAQGAVMFGEQTGMQQGAIIKIAEKKGIEIPSYAKKDKKGFESWFKNIPEDLKKELISSANDLIQKTVKYGALDESTGLRTGGFEKLFREAPKEILGDKNITKEYEDLKKSEFWAGSVLGLAESAPAFLMPGGWAAKTAAMFALTEDYVREEMSKDPDFEKISESEKSIIVAPYAIASAALETIGIRNVLASKGLLNNLIYRALNNTAGDISSKSFAEFIKNDVKSGLARGTLTLVGASLAEAETGASQRAVEIGIKEIYNSAKGKEMFKDLPKTFSEIAKDVIINGAQEAVGGGILGSMHAVSAGYRKQGFLGMGDTQFKMFEAAAKDPVLQSAFIANLKSMVNSGEITMEEAKETLNSYRNSVGLFNSIPEELNTNDKKESMNLLKERRDLERQIEGKDPALVAPITERIKSINESLTKISQNAIQEQTTNEGVLRQEGPQVGLQEMVQGDQGTGIEGAQQRQEQTAAAPAQITGLSISDPEVDARVTDEKQKGVLSFARKAVSAISSIMPGVEFIVHDNSDSYTAAVSQRLGKESKDVAGTSGYFTYGADGSVRIDVDLSKANSRTVAHEVAHAVLYKKFNDDFTLYKDFRDRLSGVISSMAPQDFVNEKEELTTVKKQLEDFVSRYEKQGENVKAEEFITELSAMLANNEAKISTSGWNKISTFIGDFVSKITGGKINLFEGAKTTRDVVDFFNSMSKAIAAGEDISGINFARRGGQAPATGQVAQGVGPASPNDAEAASQGLSVSIGEPSEIKSKASRSPIAKFPKSPLPLSFVTKADKIDIMSLIDDIISKKQTIWFWMADQLGRGNYYDEVIQGEHYLDAGPSFALDPKNRKNGILWASGLANKTLQDSIDRSDYIFFISGSPQKAKLYNKRVLELHGKRVGDFKSFKAAINSFNGSETKPLTLIKNTLNSVKSFDELAEQSSKRKPYLLAIEEVSSLKTAPDGSLKQLLESFNAFIDYNNLRDGFYRENGFNVNDIMLVGKPTGLGGKSSHSTYQTEILGEVVGVPDRVVDAWSIMPESVKASQKNITGREDKTKNLQTKIVAAETGITWDLASGEKVKGKASMIEPAKIEKNVEPVIQKIKSASLEEDQGGTFNPDGTEYKGLGLVVTGVSSNTNQKALKAKDVSDFAETHARKIQDNENVKIGLFKFNGSNEVSIDLNVIVDEKYLDQALEFATMIGQNSIWNMRTNEPIYTGQSGKSPRSFNDEQFSEIAKGLVDGKIPDFVYEEGGPDIATKASAKAAENKDKKGAEKNDAAKTQGFFSDVVSGISDKYKPIKPWSPIVGFTRYQSEFKSIFDKYMGNFDIHIATSIPTFRETQIKVGSAIVDMYSGVKGALIYDLGGSEGGFVKAITESSGGSIKSVNLDPNPEMAAAHKSKPVLGSEVIQEAFYSGFEENGVEYKTHVPTNKADVVHESMMFQFITPERDNYIKEIKDKYIKKDGLFLTEEKFSQEKSIYDANEKKKAEYKDEYYTKEQQAIKSDDVLVGMKENQADINKYKKVLEDNFDYVAQYWDSGNFKGFVASDSKSKLDQFIKKVGDTSSEFSSPNFKPEVVTKASAKATLITDKKILSQMTEDNDGNFLFYHVSPNKISGKIDPKFFGRNLRTGRDERPGIGISMYYTRPDRADVSGDYKYVAAIPKEKVYPFNSDPLNLYDKAKASFEKMYPGQAFDPNKQVAFISREAEKLGYQMTVAKWGDGLRAQTTKAIKPEWLERPNGNKVEVNEKFKDFKANAKTAVKGKASRTEVEETAKALEGMDVKNILNLRKTDYGFYTTSINNTRNIKFASDRIRVDYLLNPAEKISSEDFTKAKRNDLTQENDFVYVKETPTHLVMTEEWTEGSKKGLKDKYGDDSEETINTKFVPRIIDAASKVGIKFVSHKLEGKDSVLVFEKQTPKSISEAYHKAKEDGSNPELVKAVEDVIGAKPEIKGKASRLAPENEVSEKTLPGYDSLLSGIAKYVSNAISRGDSKADIVRTAVDIAQSSPIYESANDVQREQIVREARKAAGASQKSSPSVSRLFGIKPKDVTMTELQALNKQISDLAKGARESKNDINERRRNLSDAVRKLAASGNVSAKKVAAIINKISNLNLYSAKKVNAFIQYATNVFADADYAEKLSVANATRKQIKKLSKGADKFANLRDLGSRFSEIDPSLVSDIDEYNNIASLVKESIKGSITRGAEVRFARIANEEQINEYISDTIESQDQQLLDAKIEEAQDLLGFDATGMTYDEILELLEPNKTIAKDIENIIRSGINKAFDIYKTIINDILSTGVDSFTGDPVNYTENQKRVISEFININPGDLKIKNALEAVDALVNFITNGSIAKMESVVERYNGEQNMIRANRNGVKARALRKYGSKILGQLLIEQTASLNILFERMFGGFTSGGFMEKMIGMTDIKNGVSRAKSEADAVVKKYVEMFYDKKANGQDFNTAYNNIERGMIAFLRRGISGTQKEIKAEFDRRKNLVTESVNQLEKGNDQEKAKAKIYQEVFDKIAKNSNNFQDVANAADATNLDAVSFWIDNWIDRYQTLSDVALGIYNKVLGRDASYTPDRFSKLSYGISEVDMSSEDMSFIFNSGNASFYKKETGVLMKVTRPETLPTERYVDLSFDNNNANSLYDALVDVNTAGAIRRSESAMNSSAFKNIVESIDDRKLLVRRIKLYVNNVRKKSPFSDDTFSTVAKRLNRLATIGVGQALGGVLQPIKQVVPIAINTLINAGGLNVSSMSNKSIQDFINKSGYAIANRGIESQAQIETLDKMIDQAASSRGARALEKIEAANKWWLKNFLVRFDVAIARASWITYYEQYLKKEGLYETVVVNQTTASGTLTVSVPGIDYSNHKLNKDAADYAQRQVDRQQNVSDSDLSGAILSSKDPAKQLFTKVVMPFASFRMNQSARLGSDISTLINKTATKEDKKIAARSALGFMAEMATFRAISYGSALVIANTVGGLMDRDDDDEKEKKRKEAILKGQITSAVPDMFSPAPILDKLIQAGVQKTLESAQDIMNIDKEDRVGIYSGNKQTFLQSLGLLGVTAERASQLWETVSLSVDGEFTDDYGKRKKISDKNMSTLGMLAPISILSSIGLAPTEVSGIVRGAVKIAKSDAESVNKESKKQSRVNKEDLKKLDPQLYKEIYGPSGINEEVEKIKEEFK